MISKIEKLESELKTERQKLESIRILKEYILDVNEGVFELNHFSLEECMKLDSVKYGLPNGLELLEIGFEASELREYIRKQWNYRNNQEEEQGDED